MHERLKHDPVATFLLDFSDCEYPMDVHELMAEELEFLFYGYNLDALWDNLTGMIYVPADVTIIYRPKTRRAKELRPLVEKIIEVFMDAQKQYGNIYLTVHCDPA